MLGKAWRMVGFGWRGLRYLIEPQTSTTKFRKQTTHHFLFSSDEYFKNPRLARESPELSFAWHSGTSRLVSA